MQHNVIYIPLSFPLLHSRLLYNRCMLFKRNICLWIFQHLSALCAFYFYYAYYWVVHIYMYITCVCGIHLHFVSGGIREREREKNNTNIIPTQVNKILPLFALRSIPPLCVHIFSSFLAFFNNKISTTTSMRIKKNRAHPPHCMCIFSACLGHTHRERECVCV